MTSRRYCTCTVGDLLVGIDIDRVQEVLRHQIVTPVPLSAPSVLGLLHLRGQIITVLDGRRRLGLPAREAATPSTHVIVRGGGELVSVVVDAEGDVVEIDDAELEMLPTTVGSTLRAVVSGAARPGGALMLVLDPDRFVSVTGN